MTNVSICLRMKEAAFPKDTFPFALKSAVKISAQRVQKVEVSKCDIDIYQCLYLIHNTFTLALIKQSSKDLC